MIISASRRTDIPAFYAEWMLHRLRAGYCTVANPFNRNQVSRISLRPEDVDAIVFWTRNPRPLMRYIPRIGLPRIPLLLPIHDTGISSGNRPQIAACRGGRPDIPRTFGATWPNPGDLALRSHRLYWAHPSGVSPVRTSSVWPNRSGAIRVRSVVSIVDMYRKTESRMRTLEGTPAAVQPCDPAEFQRLMCRLGRTRPSERDGHRQLRRRDRPAAIRHPARQVRGRPGDHRGIRHGGSQERRIPTQRKACGCVVSRDIGMYESCLYGCQCAPDVSGQAQEHGQTRRTLLTMLKDRGRLVGHRG